MSSRFDHSNHSGPYAGKSRRSVLFFALLLFVIGTVLSLTGRQGAVTAQVDVEKLGVMGSYGDPVFIDLDEITEIQLVDEVDFGTIVDAQETGNTMCGTYRSDAYDTYDLYVFMKKSPFIVITYGAEDSVLVFNQASERLTKKMYEDLTGG